MSILTYHGMWPGWTNRWPLSAIGPRCHELRIPDAQATWRIVFRNDANAIVIAEVFSKKTQVTPRAVIETSRRRLKQYDTAAAGEEEP